jgi:hypothetical protein
MKPFQVLKKFPFVKKLAIDEKKWSTLGVQLLRILKGSSSIEKTPLAKNSDLAEFIYDWDQVFKENLSLMNPTLLEMERANRSKIGPRSIAVPWSERVAGLTDSYSHQSEHHVCEFKYEPGPGNLIPVSVEEAASKAKTSSSAGLPELTKKGKCVQRLLDDFDNQLNRKDPCMLYTRTTELKKTRNVWGYPFADTLFEQMFYIPLLYLQKQKPYRAALVSPDEVAKRISELIHYAMAHGLLLYSVDFAAFDASVRYQYIIYAFDYIKSCFIPEVHPFLDYICERVYTIGIVTPSRVFHGKHGVPSGCTFTNELDSIIQLGVAMVNPFIKASDCVVQGDDGVYMLSSENVPIFEETFKRAGLRLEKSKSVLAPNHVIFCQNLYHIDYADEDGHIGGIYSTYRAINRILFQEKFTELKKMDIRSQDYFGIRTLTILENCKYHPLFEDLVKFILARERFSLDISDDGIAKYCAYKNQTIATEGSLNHQYGSIVSGIKDFRAYKLVKDLLKQEAMETDEEHQICLRLFESMF